MTLDVRAFDPTDAEAFRAIYRTYLAHYGIGAATQDQETRVLAMLTRQRHMACHLAFEGDIAMGFATWGLNLPAGAGISLVMKELFVAPQTRKMGVGKALLSALITVARDEGCERFDWATDGANKAAQAYYAALGAPDVGKRNYRVMRDGFDRFQSGLNAGR